MSGHSKWSKIKRKKAVTDAKKSKVQSKLIREITIAARNGADPDGNPRLRSIVATSRAENMPNDTIERAILRGSGQLEGVVFEECVYEGYGPSGVALYIEVMTDNRNRSAAELRHILGKFGGSLGEPNSVVWLFEKRGLILVDDDGVDEEELMMAALEAGAHDVVNDEGMFEIVTDADALDRVEDKLRGQNYPVASAREDFVPQSTVRLVGADAHRLLGLLEGLDELDDVSEVYANFDMDDDVMAQFKSSSA
jgi:YebC/PmpR family DNA-binding regulatory protein